MPPRRTRSISNSGSKPRLFQCTGYGDCHMVFSRSEHLARHARKHTGEKPFKCIVPECNKMFSRFDNMMQHTQTHRSTLSKSSEIKHHYSQRRRKASAGLTINTEGAAKSSHTEEPLISPVSLPSCSAGEDLQRRRRRLSIADLCNPSQEASSNNDTSRELSKDEVEALQAFGRLHHTAPDFFESLQNLVCDTSDHRPCVCL